MQKQKIYWFLQQIENIGGTEMVTSQIINLLSNDYDITLVSAAKISNKMPYSINKNVKLLSLDIPVEYTQLDKYFNTYCSHLHFLKAFKLLFSSLNSFLFKRKKYKNKILEMTNPEDILVFSSQELLMFAPKERYIYQHFHYNSFLYFSFVNRLLRLVSRKPDFRIFLSNSTMKAIDKKNTNSTFIYNPTRFDRVLNNEFHNNNLIFVGRFESQKDPMFLLKAMKEANKLKIDYHLTIYGNGSYRKKMENYIKKYSLNKLKIIDNCFDMKPHYLDSDLLLSTSRYEGYPLVALEANSLSCPVLWLNIKDPTQDIICSGYNGYVVNRRSPKIYALKLKEILENRNKLIQMKQSSYEYSKKYEIENIYNKWRDLFDSHQERIKNEGIITKVKINRK